MEQQKIKTRKKKSIEQSNYQKKENYKPINTNHPDHPLNRRMQLNERMRCFNFFSLFFSFSLILTDLFLSIHRQFFLPPSLLCFQNLFPPSLFFIISQHKHCSLSISTISVLLLLCLTLIISSLTHNRSHKQKK